MTRELRVNPTLKIKNHDAESLHTALPLATIAEVSFSDERAMQRYRIQLYSINKNNAAGWRYRTERCTYSKRILYVWRMA